MNDTPTPRTKEIWGAMLYTYPFLINCVTETGEMEVELTAAREELKAVTEQRDEFHVKIEELAIKLEKSKSYKNVMKRDNAELRKQLTAAREEITLLKTNLKIQTNHTENAVQDRADEHIELHNQIQELTEQRDEALSDLEFRRDLYSLQTKQLDDVRNQRDRLAEALHHLTTHGDYHQPMLRDTVSNIANEALQSLTTTEP